MTLTGSSVRVALLEQTERTRQCSKAEIERIIEEYETEIVSLQSQIDALTESRDSRRARVLALKYIMSPIRSLPVELLAEIFDLAIADETHVEDAHRISQICSDWRRVAHSTPRLWTRPLKVKLAKKGDLGDNLKAWLARSGPMTVHISLISGHKGINPGILEEVMKVVPRLGSLNLSSNSKQSWLQLVRQLAQRQLGRLEKLQLTSWMDPTLAFTTVPRLRKLTLIGLEDVPSQNLVPWAQITDLTLSDNSHDNNFGILALCPNLVMASITTYGWRDRPQIQPNPLILNHLHTLTLHLLFIAQPRHITPIFDRLSTPLLQSLRVDLGDCEVSWIAADFTTFQLRAPNITRLEFANSGHFISKSLEAAIRSPSSLTHLTLTFCTGFDDDFINILHYKDGMVPPLAPCLHTLIVKNISPNFTEDILAGMIASRWWTDTELASLEALPAVTRWKYVEFKFHRKYTFGTKFAEMLTDIPSDVLVHSH
ncbi:hypothetical protein C8R45DRAFT_1041777 [Mycena sanguinolenta]|nr:hypothetical protein C8R45DRAFT_1041777 [Mycena sanguinolenta]